MAGAMRKMAVYLGLVEDEDRFDDYDDYEDTDGATSRDSRHDERSRPVSTMRTGSHEPAREHTGATVSPMPERRPGPSVRPAPAGGLDRITTIHPRAYNDAKTIGESFRDSTPVIMNLTDMDDQDAKRLVDFAAGLVFGLRGSIERVTNKVFLLSPTNVTVTAEDKARMAENGFFNQS